MAVVTYFRPPDSFNANCMMEPDSKGPEDPYTGYLPESYGSFLLQNLYVVLLVLRSLWVLSLVTATCTRSFEMMQSDGFCCILSMLCQTQNPKP